MKSFLKFLLYIFSSVVFAIFVLIGWIYLYPQSAWKLTEKYLLPSDLSIRWEDLQLNIEQKQWLEYNLYFKVTNLNISKAEPKIEMPIDSVKLHLAIHILATSWWDIEEIEVIGNKDISLYASRTEAKNTESENFYQQASKYIDYLSRIQPDLTENVLIDLKAILFHPLEGPLLRSKVNIHKTSEETIEANLTVNQESLNLQVLLQFTPNNIHTNQPMANITSTFSNELLSIQTVLQSRYTNNTLHVDIQADGTYKHPPQTIKISSQGTALLDASKLKLNLATDVNHLPGAIHRLDKILFEATMPQHENQIWSNDPTTFKISNSLNLLSLQPKLRTSLEQACKCKMPQLFDAEINGRVYIKNAISDSTAVQKVVDANIKLAPIQNPLFYANMALDLAILRDNQTWLYEPALDADIRIDSFKALQQFLDYYRVLIPSPLDALDGKIYLSAKSPLEKTDTSLSTKVDVKIDLSSKLQKVSVRSDLVVEILKTLKEITIYNTTFIDQIKLEVPPIDPILGIPPVSQDKRFVSIPTKKAEPSLKLTLYNTIQTTTDGSIQLLSSYLKPYAPITVDVKTNDNGGIFGKLKIEPLEIKYLRRKVFVEYVDLKLSGTEDPMTLNGRLRIEQADYKIFIDIIGTADAPVIQLNSEPALSQSDIISVILYGRVSDQLVSAESETAGSVSAAIADRAIGLFGLWAFASTPIQSFSYNSITKVYTATIQLADGLTAGIGTNWEQSTSFEVRKRLSRRWVLSASWINGDNQDRSERLMLQWEKRF